MDDRVAALSAHLVVHLVTAAAHGQAEETSQRLGGQLVRRTGLGSSLRQLALMLAGIGTIALFHLGR